MSIKVVMNGVTVNNANNLPIKNKNGTTIGTIALSEVGTIATPTATKQITSNGTGIDVLNYSKVDVNVPTTGGTTPTYQEKTVTTNGTVTPDSGFDALSKVTVNVPVGVTPSGKLNIADTGVKDVTTYAQAQVYDPNLVAGNIKKGVPILGITGSYEASGSATEDDSYIDIEIDVAQDLTPVTLPTPIFEVVASGNGQRYFETVNKIINDCIEKSGLFYYRLEYVGPERTDLQTYPIVSAGISNGVSPLTISASQLVSAGTNYANGFNNSNSVFSLQVDTRDAQTRGIKINYRKNFTFNELTVIPSGKYKLRFGRM